uniref:Uncharacterized protein n=1 Tax=Romanomermis culicivorax TaxID=13658 RepID=A0A915L8C2_ROMCU
MGMEQKVRGDDQAQTDKYQRTEIKGPDNQINNIAAQQAADWHGGSRGEMRHSQTLLRTEVDQSMVETKLEEVSEAVDGHPMEAEEIGN